MQNDCNAIIIHIYSAIDNIENLRDNIRDEKTPRKSFHRINKLIAWEVKAWTITHEVDCAETYYSTRIMRWLGCRPAFLSHSG